MGRELGNCHHVLLAFWQQYLLYNIFAITVFTLPGAGAGAGQPVNTAGAGAGAGETQYLEYLHLMRAASTTGGHGDRGDELCKIFTYWSF